MELSIFTRAKITIVLLVGVLLVGLVGHNLIKPSQTDTVVVFYGGQIGIAPLIILIILGFVSGFISTFIARPYGKEIGVLAAPAGLGFITLISGNITDLIRHNSLENQAGIYSALKWEPILWCLIPLSGILGAIVGNITMPPKSPLPVPVQIKPVIEFKKGYLSLIVSTILAAIIAHFAIGLFVRDVSVSNNNIAAIVQPEKLQIAFGVYVSFLVAAFVVKLILNSSYIWVCASIIVVYFVESTMAGASVKATSENFPVSFFLHSGFSILPIEIISWGTLGAITGFWAAVRYNYWKNFQDKMN